MRLLRGHSRAPNGWGDKLVPRPSAGPFRVADDIGPIWRAALTVEIDSRGFGTSFESDSHALL